MSWREVSALSQRKEFVLLAQQEGCNFASLCKAYNISRKTGYKWLSRFLESGDSGLLDLSRRPNSSPFKSGELIEIAITSLRKMHPAWGGRKLKSRLENLGYQHVPAASTITSILRRGAWLDLAESTKHKPFLRFEHPYPNALWQMDFKGHIPIRHGRCHPLTILDDNSRYSIILKACPDEKTETVKNALIDSFRRYGLPDRMTMDNGSPWGNSQLNELTHVTAWLVRVGVGVSHSRPYHPQTQGKDERFHRTLNAEAIRGQQFEDLNHCQRRFNEFRDVYNLERPHEALGMKAPISRYQPSQRCYPETLPPIEYGPDDQIRKVQSKGEIFFKGKIFRVDSALQGQPVGLRPTNMDGIYSVYYCHQKLKEIDLMEP